MVTIRKHDWYRFIVYSVKFFKRNPSRFPRAAYTFSKAIVKHLISGKSLVTHQQFDERTTTCVFCIQKKFDLETLSCRECGCFIPIKAALPQEQCPFLYWQILAETDDDIKRVREINYYERLLKSRLETEQETEKKKGQHE